MGYQNGFPLIMSNLHQNLFEFLSRKGEKNHNLRQFLYVYYKKPR